MNKEISNKIINYAKNNESIEAIYYLEDNSYDSFIHIYTIVNEVIVGKMEDELVQIFDDVILLNRQKDELSFEKDNFNYTSLNIYTANNLKLTESIISEDFVDAFIKSVPEKIKVLYSKPGFYKLEVSNDFSYQKPKEYEVMYTIKNFFATAYETSLFIDEKDSIAASLKLEDVRKYLTNIVDFYVKNKYAYKLSMGDDGQNLTNTLEYDIKENYLLTFSHDDLMDIYFSLFKACVLFRRLAMEICKELGYAYPKEIDVETLKVLRKNYKKLESFIN